MESNANIPVVIMAGGYGTRMSNNPERIPKPLVPVGSFPIIRHIMKVYYHYGFRRFYIAAGFKHELIKEYFLNYVLKEIDYIGIKPNIKNNIIYTKSDNEIEDWEIHIVNTGLETMTGGRLLKIRPYIENDEFFCMTYGDSIGDINLDDLIKYHNNHEKIATVTSVRPTEKYGILDIHNNGIVNTFEEKPDGVDKWINGGFFVLEDNVFDYIKEDTMFEQDPLRNLVKDDQLIAFHHHGFWAAMDTPKERNDLEKLWNEGKAKWKIWE